jgi:hypothetical protein
MLMTGRHLMRNLSFLLSAGLIFALLAGCLPSNQQASDGGSGSEVTGTARYADSGSSGKVRVSDNAAWLPVISGMVYMYPKTFEPDSSMISGNQTPKAYTGNDGSFLISHVPIGVYVVEVADGHGKAKSREVTVPDDSMVIDAGVFILESVGRIKFHVNIDLPGEVLYYVYLEGTRHVMKGTQSGIDMVLDGIPSGVTYTLTVRMVKPIPGSVSIEDVRVSAGEITDVLPVDF